MKKTVVGIDIDYEKHRRQEVIDYVASIQGIEFAEIITFNTISEKGGIKEVGRALNIPLPEVDMLSKAVDDKSIDKYRKMDKYKELFYYVDLLDGTVMSMGSHPSGYVVSPKDINLRENISTLYTKESKYQVTAINMEELERLNYIKLDMLGLRNMDVINGTCELAGIERVTPDNLDITDIDVWMSLRESTMAIFQLESTDTEAYIKTMFSNNTLRSMSNDINSIDFISLLSMANGAIRPAGESYRHSLSRGEVKDNGHIGLNNLLAPTLGNLVFQEQITEFLMDFCGYDGASADVVRRILAKKKKEDIDVVLPQIEKAFVDTMTVKHNETREHALEILSSFLRVIEDASDYAFSKNHSQAYSYIGYACAYLRYHYPKEFATTLLNVYEDKEKKTREIVSYMKDKKMSIEPISYGKSGSRYTLDKEDGKIYKGIKSIKYLNEAVANELLELSKTKHDNFVDLLVDMQSKTSADTRQTTILIRLDFFRQYGNSKYLELIYEEFSKRHKKTLKDTTKAKRLEEIKEYAETLVNIEDYSISEKIAYEQSVLGYVQIIDESLDPKTVVVTALNTKYSPVITGYMPHSGRDIVLKMAKDKFYNYDGSQIMTVGTSIIVNSVTRKPKMRKINGKWEKGDTIEMWIDSYDIINI